MPLNNLTSAEVLRRPTVIYNAADGSGRTFGATVVTMSTRAPTPGTAVSLTTSTAGGTMPTATGMTYRYVAIIDGAESLPSTAATITTGAGSTNSVTVSMPPVGGAEAYALYGRTAGSEVYMGTFAGTGTLTFVDTGATISSTQTVPSGAMPANSITLRVPELPGGPRTTSPRLIVGVQPATTLGQAGRYEYHRV